MKAGSILVVDDHKHVLSSILQVLEPHFSEVTGLSNPNRIPELLRTKNIDVVLLDMNYSAGINTGNEGLYWLREIKKADEAIQVIPISAYGEVGIAVDAIKAGATDFIQKPWDNEKLIATLKTALQLRISRLKIEKLYSRQSQLISTINAINEPMIVESPAMKEIMSIVEKVAATDANILVTGENGTGKGLLVKTIHNLSLRRAQALITVDLGALSEGLFESELFGHKKGAFTDANQDRTGRFTMASGSTLFLDEIGNVPIHLQGKLLTVIQEKVITPLGMNDAYRVDVRLICATNRNLKQLVEERLFREDLLFRINTIEIRIPPLRERKEDIPAIAVHYLRHYASKYGKEGLRLNQDTLDLLCSYQWPGNIRELKHVVEKTVILSDNSIIKPSDLRLELSRESASVSKTLTLSEIEREAILNALVKHNFNVKGAAIELNISRQTLYNKMEKYQL